MGSRCWQLRCVVLSECQKVTVATMPLWCRLVVIRLDMRLTNAPPRADVHVDIDADIIAMSTTRLRSTGAGTDGKNVPQCHSLTKVVPPASRVAGGTSRREDGRTSTWTDC